jgi:hypothetical protein
MPTLNLSNVRTDELAATGTPLLDPHALPETLSQAAVRQLRRDLEPRGFDLRRPIRVLVLLRVRGLVLTQ